MLSFLFGAPKKKKATKKMSEYVRRHRGKFAGLAGLGAGAAGMAMYPRMRKMYDKRRAGPPVEFGAPKKKRATKKMSEYIRQHRGKLAGLAGAGVAGGLLWRKIHTDALEKQSYNTPIEFTEDEKNIIKRYETNPNNLVNDLQWGNFGMILTRTKNPQFQTKILSLLPEIILKNPDLMDELKRSLDQSNKAANMPRAQFPKYKFGARKSKKMSEYIRRHRGKLSGLAGLGAGAAGMALYPKIRKIYEERRARSPVGFGARGGRRRKPSRKSSKKSGGSKKDQFLKMVMQNAPSILAVAGLAAAAIAAAVNRDKIKSILGMAVTTAPGAVPVVAEKVVENENVEPGKVKLFLATALEKLKGNVALARKTAENALDAGKRRGGEAYEAVKQAVAESKVKVGEQYEKVLDKYIEKVLTKKEEAVAAQFGYYRFGKRSRRTRRRASGSRKPPAKLLRMCKKYKIKVTMKRGSKRVYKSASVLKKQLKKKMRGRKVHPRRRRRSSFGGLW